MQNVSPEIVLGFIFAGKFQDLKKQTALRLAQEQNDYPLQQDIYVGGIGVQQQGGQFYPRNPNNSYAYSSPDPTVTVPYPRHVPHPQDGISNVHITTDNEQRQLQHFPSQEEQERQQHHMQQPSGYLGVSTYNQMNSIPPQDQNAIPPGIGDSHMMVSYVLVLGGSLYDLAINSLF